jgi:CMP-2-keto-3-deoxyoctulosonic acid synthetase
MPKAKAGDDTVIFNQAVKHGTHRFLPRSKVKFETDGAAEYFVKCGWADFTDQKPDVIIQEDELTIDPETIHTETGLKVKDLKVKTGS